MPGLLLFYRCMMGRCKIFPFFCRYLLTDTAPRVITIPSYRIGSYLNKSEHTKRGLCHEAAVLSETMLTPAAYPSIYFPHIMTYKGDHYHG